MFSYFANCDNVQYDALIAQTCKMTARLDA